MVEETRRIVVEAMESTPAGFQRAAQSRGQDGQDVGGVQMSGVRGTSFLR